MDETRRIAVYVKTGKGLRALGNHTAQSARELMIAEYGVSPEHRRKLVFVPMYQLDDGMGGNH